MNRFNHERHAYGLPEEIELAKITAEYEIAKHRRREVTDQTSDPNIYQYKLTCKICNQQLEPFLVTMTVTSTPELRYQRKAYVERTLKDYPIIQDHFARRHPGQKFKLEINHQLS